MLTRACVLVLNRGGTYWNPAGRIQRSTDTEARARSRIPSLASIKGDEKSRIKDPGFYVNPVDIDCEFSCEFAGLFIQVCAMTRNIADPG